MPPHPHCHWRGAQEWKDLGLEMSTTSDEACKLFDECLTQVVNLYDDETLGGLAATTDRLIEADPEFVLGHVIRLGIGGQKIENNYNFAQDIYRMSALAEKAHVKPWERKHAQAVRLFAEGRIEAASAAWEAILVDHPLDMLALRLLEDMCIVSGYSNRMRDGCARVLPLWKPDMPFYGNLLGMYAFGLEETNFYSEAEKTARKALAINPHDAWAAHAVSHVKEMTGDIDAGIMFMSDTENNWSDSHLACHNYWHWALYYMEKGDIEATLELLDSQVIPRMKKSRSCFAMTDTASMLFRLDAQGCDVGRRWADCYDVAKDHVGDHMWSYTDVNSLISCLWAGRRDDAAGMLDGVKDFSRSGFGDIRGVYGEVTIPLMEAVMAYSDGDYGRAVDVMKATRYDVWRIGGSHAQRDLINLFEIHSALKSTRAEDKNYARHLLMERNSKKAETPLAVKLMEQAAQHVLVAGNTTHVV